jgi:hypothetical protein
MPNVFVVSRYIKGQWPDIVWELCGIYSTKEKASEACITKFHGYTELPIDEAFPEEITPLPNIQYLLSEDDE